MSINTDDLIPFDFNFNNTTSPRTITQLQEQIHATVDKIYQVINLAALHLTAASTTNLESIPSPAQPGPYSPLTLHNHFLLEASPPTSTTQTSGGANYHRHILINAALGHEVTRDRNSFNQYSIELTDLIRELTTAYPIVLPTQDSTHPNPNELHTGPVITLNDLAPHNIGDIPSNTIHTILQQHQDALQLKTKAEFESNEEYIQYLRSYRKDLYHKVQRQSEIINRLHSRALQLQQSMGLYRGQ